MNMKLKYANEDKSMDYGQWILDYNYLSNIAEKLQGSVYTTDLETIEAVLLVANGECALWKKSLEAIENEGGL